VLGQTFAFDDLQRMGDQPEEEVEEALAEALSAGLVQIAGEEAYTFSHVLIQQAMYAELLPRRRRRLHLAAGQAIEGLHERRRETRVAELAWHFLEAGDGARALPYTLIAGDQAGAVFGHDEAEQHYRTVLDLAQELGAELRKAEGLEKLGTVLLRTGRYGEALGMLEQAAGIHHGANDLPSEGRVVALIGQAHASRGTPDEGLQRVTALIRILEGSQPSRPLAALYDTLARLHQACSHYVECVDAAVEASRIAAAVGDTAIRLQAEATRGYTLMHLARHEEALQALQEVTAIAETQGDPASLAGTLCNLGAAYFLTGVLDRAKVCQEQALALGERTGDPIEIAAPLVDLGNIAFFLGSWSEARVQYERAAKTVEHLGAVPWLAHAQTFLGWLSLAEGDWQEAARHLESAISILRRRPDELLPVAEAVMAELELFQGMTEAALARLEPYATQESIGASQALWVLALAYLEVGDAVAAERTADDAVMRYTRQGVPMGLADALRARGFVLTHRERWEEAEKAFRDAVSESQRLPYPYAEARAQSEWGRMLLRRGEPQRGRKTLEEALAIFQRLGARKDVDRTEQALEEMG
jgi:tetratricopeptide (TPR) repeat protein